MKRPPAIILLGLKHSGKSTLAVRLSSDLRRRYIDLDEIIESLYRADRLVSCREIYKRHGKDFFVSLETQAAQEVAQMLRLEVAVLALGGGTGENEKAMEELACTGIFVYLQLGEECLYERIMSRGLPAFLPADHPEVAFHTLFARRHEIYRRYADIVVDLDGLDRDEAYARLTSTIMEHADAG